MFVDSGKESPKVLLLYSYDCSAHEEVVKKFANYLKTPGKLKMSRVFVVVVCFF